MLKAKKGNRIVRIPDEKKDTYAKLGYEITTMDGKVIHEPNNAKKEAEQLKKTVSELEARLSEASGYAENADKKIEELTAENESLKKTVSELEARLAGAVKKAEPAPAEKTPESAKTAPTTKQATK